MIDRVQWDPQVGHPAVETRWCGPVRWRPKGMGICYYRKVTYGVVRGTEIVVHAGDYLERDERAPGGWRVMPRTKAEASNGTSEVQIVRG